MGLILCVECRKDVSDQVENCPHCGYPTSASIKHFENNKYLCLINGKLHDLSAIKKMIDTNEGDWYRALFKETNLEDDGVFALFKYLRDDTLPREFNSQVNTPLSERRDLPRCPTCNSTSIGKIGGWGAAASTLMLGPYSDNFNKIFECYHCGYKW